MIVILQNLHQWYEAPIPRLSLVLATLYARSTFHPFAHLYSTPFIRSYGLSIQQIGRLYYEGPSTREEKVLDNVHAIMVKPAVTASIIGDLPCTCRYCTELSSRSINVETSYGT